MTLARMPIVALSVIVCLLATSCGDDGPATYDGAKTCGVGTDRAVAVLGTDHYEVITRGATSLPSGQFDCHANTADHDYALAVIVAPADDRVRAEQEGYVAQANVHFDHGKGQIGIVFQNGDDFTGAWICGDMRAYVTAVVGDDYTDTDGRNLMTSMADVVGCRIPS